MTTTDPPTTAELHTPDHTAEKPLCGAMDCVCWAFAQPFRCRCVWRGEQCENRATEEDGLCNWCCRTQRSIHRLRQDPRAVVVSDTEVSIGGAGQTHDYDASRPASTAACWYPDSDRTVLNA